MCWKDERIQVLRRFVITEAGVLRVEICSVESDGNLKHYEWKNEGWWLDGHEEQGPTDESDQNGTGAEDDVYFTWYAYDRHENWGSPGDPRTACSLRHLRGFLTGLLGDVHFATRALGSGRDPLVLEFSAPDGTPHQYARLELSPTDVCLYARVSPQTRAYLTEHGFTDLNNELAERRWPAGYEHARSAATATVVFLHHVDLKILGHDEDEDEDDDEYEGWTYTEEPNVIMSVSGDPLPLDVFEVPFVLARYRKVWAGPA